MSQIQTKYFGPTDCQPDSIFQFPAGLPGFETEQSFVFLDRPGTHPLIFMQSVTDPNLCFVLLPILAADPQYRLSLAADDRDLLRLTADREPEIGKDILCAAIVCAADESRPLPTVNLLAPVVLNLRERIGMQVIQSESEYSHQRPLFPREELASCS
jgi:flagellar assembly factor FliW